MITQEVKDFIKGFEGLILKPERDKLKPSVINIGYGNTFYPNGKSVKLSDPPITREQANSIFNTIVQNFANSVKSLIKQPINENQLGALTSLAYNIGIENFKTSTLLKKVNINPNSDEIEKEFLKWVFVSKKFTPGLQSRREKEILIYKKKSLV